jgi:hypothetical protein
MVLLFFSLLLASPFSLRNLFRNLKTAFWGQTQARCMIQLLKTLAQQPDILMTCRCGSNGKHFLLSPASLFDGITKGLADENGKLFLLSPVSLFDGITKGEYWINE